MTLGPYTKEQKHTPPQNILAKLSSFGQLSFIGYPKIDFQNSQNEVDDLNGHKNINYLHIKCHLSFLPFENDEGHTLRKLSLKMRITLTSLLSKHSLKPFL